MRASPLVLPSIAFAALAVACGGEGAETSPAPSPEQGLSCAAGEEAFRGRCVDPARRYEPDAPLDTNNVVDYGAALESLTLPDPPKSGFRIVAPPRDMQPGEEVDFCIAWPLPETTHRVVYAARLYTTPGLHHSNVVTKAIDEEKGPNPYPSCHPGADDPFAQLPDVIPDVLFANSTQVVGEETLAFSPGHGFVLGEGREIATNIHFLNAGSEPLRVEVAYDVFTMPAEELTTEVAPFFAQVNDFLIPPHTTADVGTECKVFGGNVVSMMPHTHRLATRFTVDVVPPEGEPRRVLDDGAYDLESDIVLYEPPLELLPGDSVRFSCTFANTTDHDVVYGLGDDEMCILFGYMHPVKSQFVAYSEYQGEPCKSFQIGLFR